MSHILSRPAVKLDVQLSTSRVPDRLPETLSTTFTKRTTADATLKVDDESIRKQAPGFDGRERPFLMLPAEHEGQVTWYRHELQYRGPTIAGPWDFRTVDSFSLEPVQNVDRAAIEKYGVALGLDTNVGTLWAQEPGENFKVREDPSAQLWR